MGFFEKIKKGLEKTKNSLFSSLESVIKSFKAIDEDLFDELEEILVMSDMGINTVDIIMQQLRDKVKEGKIKEPEQILSELKSIILSMLEKNSYELKLNTKPSIILMVGVNGVGKTTTIAKLAHSFILEKKRVLLAAADTFRAAAIDQLGIWADRVGAEMIKHQEGSDPAAVVFDAISAAKARGSDIIICDTAGRLHNKVNLMNELNKIFRVIERELPDADLEVLLVLDATTGQNALIQAKEFIKTTNLTGLVLTKLDGTAKGGVIVGIANELNIPVKFVGVGEMMDDLQPFDPVEFVNALFE